MITLAKMEDAREIHQVMWNVYANLEQKELYYPDSLEFIKNCIREKGFAVKACSPSGRIMGFLIVYFPTTKEDHMGQYIDLTQEDYEKSAYMDSIAVLPEYRGLGIQKQLIEYAEKSEKLKEYLHLFATVSPENLYSLKNFQAEGYQIISTVFKYANLERHVLYKRKQEELQSGHIY